MSYLRRSFSSEDTLVRVVGFFFKSRAAVLYVRNHFGLYTRDNERDGIYEEKDDFFLI